ncbi:Rrf2 family transcriptional regulator [Mucilaginibacter sp. dw_454]|uniref:RrF2 family transcriptional regulator n=1 Tax=Mucilaginibacter sp. dw_454 TaxID=2720079 RepID=UPI001BD5DD41|nr:Rrf2 family transcriptional regulator [Mucilaginibacter sp. dw_454]
MLSKKAKYAIKALILLGKNYKQRSLNAVQIADAENIPQRYLRSILSDLKIGGYIYSLKGVDGGYSLRESPEKITLDKIIRQIDGPIARISCASIFHYHKCDECAEEVTCSIRDLFIDIREADFKILSGTSIADMISKEGSLVANLLLNQKK